MKNKLYFVIITLVVSGFLSLQIGWDIYQLKAEQSSTENNESALYERLYKSTEFSSMTSQKLKLTEIKSPIVIINFWASWCVPCLKEFPSLVELKSKLGDKLTVIAINGDEEDAENLVKKMSEKYKLNFFHVLDPKSEISDKFLVNSYPFTLVYIKGKVTHVFKKNHNFLDSNFIQELEK